MRKSFAWTLGVSALLALAGCGGGGSSSGSTPGTGSATSRVAVFASSSPNAAYDQVWVTVTSVSLVSSSGAYKVFEDPNGRVIDVRALSAAGARKMEFLGTGSAPSGAYSSAQINIRPEIVVVPAGATQGRTVRVQKADTGKMPAEVPIAVEFGAGVTLNDKMGNLIVSFDLPRWNDASGTIDPVVVGDTSISPSDTGVQLDSDFHGTVSDLAGVAPNLNFNIVGDDGRTIPVRMTDTTVVMNSDGSANPKLDNGMRVRGIGKFDAKSQAVVADVLFLMKFDSLTLPQHARGTSSDWAPGAAKFTLNLKDADGFVPTSSVLTVVTDPTTIVFSESGIVSDSNVLPPPPPAKPEIERTAKQADMATLIDVEGSYDAATNTLRAVRMRVVQPGSDKSRLVRYVGPVDSVDAATFSFSMTVKDSFGTIVPVTAAVKVLTDEKTQFGEPAGSPMDKDAFFTALKAGDVVAVSGALENNGLKAANVLKLPSTPPPPPPVQ